MSMLKMENIGAIFLILEINKLETGLSIQNYILLEINLRDSLLNMLDFTYRIHRSQGRMLWAG